MPIPNPKTRIEETVTFAAAPAKAAYIGTKGMDFAKKIRLKISIAANAGIATEIGAKTDAVAAASAGEKSLRIYSTETISPPRVYSAAVKGRTTAAVETMPALDALSNAPSLSEAERRDNDGNR